MPGVELFELVQGVEQVPLVPDQAAVPLGLGGTAAPQDSATDANIRGQRYRVWQPLACSVVTMFRRT